jgi:hypothetical protein
MIIAPDEQTEPAARLDPNKILEREFEYARETASQAIDDRSKVTNLYLMTLAGFIATIMGVASDPQQLPLYYWAFVALFGILAAYSLLTLLQLVRLREAWFESVRAMNAVKDYYLHHCTAPGLDTAFAWRTGTIPARYKPWSVSFLLAMQVAVLGAVSCGAAVMFATLCAGWECWPLAVALGAVFFVLQMGLYRRLLHR